jgi:hypothetical protein
MQDGSMKKTCHPPEIERILKKLNGPIPQTRLTRQESGRLAAYRNNSGPFEMTPNKLEARRKGGRVSAARRQELNASEKLRSQQAEEIDQAYEDLRSKQAHKPTYAEIAKKTGYNVRTVRRVRAWQNKALRSVRLLGDG